ncbi:hypothetical protein Ddye_002037 [Dipteronia dyeriana]|uniref:1-phosphatidylinositol 4-kinase n=1 Tax=Dipteronia dyeriana TaxID=168575 RepID=A0AAE0CUK7_9ROSI|nr:hypothetical protein Ddye_002037 [Dipteronia dyeriana]
MHSIFNLNDGVIGNKLLKRKKISKIASLQQFIPHDFDASDYGTSSFPVAAVHKIGILDIRIFNTDRHAGNLLVRKLDGVGRFGQVELIPIDHGLCLPESLEDPYFEWMHWPQASIPFSEDELDYIKNLDPVHDSEMLRTELPMIREACLHVLVLCTIFLQEAADFGLCLAEMMSREFHGDEEEPSEFEVVCLEARKIIAETEMSFFDADGGEEEEFLFDIDCEDPELDPALRVTRDISIEGSFNYGNEVEEDEKPIGEERFSVETHSDWLQSASKLYQSVKEVNFHDSILHCHRKSISDTRRSANEQLPTSSSFVTFADMSEEEWILFLEKVKELLPPAFAKRRNTTIGWKQRHRVGTSCKF